MRKRRIALYGGTFDPIHIGHLTVARNLTELLALDEVLFVPAYIAPHKREQQPTPALHRYALLALATQHDARFRISTLELDAPDKPYTIDTLARFRTMLNETARLFLIIGADSWEEIRTWREWEKLLRENSIIVVTRPGYELGAAHMTREIQACIVDLRDASQVKFERALEVETPQIFWTNAAMVDVSATEIRRAVCEKRGDELTQLISPPVAEYIAKYELYKN